MKIIPHAKNQPSRSKIGDFRILAFSVRYWTHFTLTIVTTLISRPPSNLIMIPPTIQVWTMGTHFGTFGPPFDTPIQFAKLRVGNISYKKAYFTPFLALNQISGKNFY